MISKLTYSSRSFSFCSLINRPTCILWICYSIPFGSVNIFRVSRFPFVAMLIRSGANVRDCNSLSSSNSFSFYFSSIISFFMSFIEYNLSCMPSYGSRMMFSLSLKFKTYSFLWFPAKILDFLLTWGLKVQPFSWASYSCRFSFLTCYFKAYSLPNWASYYHLYCGTGWSGWAWFRFVVSWEF